MQATADVVVIGGGVIGCSTAYSLAKAGVGDVALVEKTTVGAGSSSKSAAMLSLQFCQDGLTLEMAKQSYAAYMNFEEEMGTPIDFHKIGWLFVATKESAQALRRQAALLQENGVATEVLDPGEVKARFPALNCEDIVLGTYGPDDGPFDPHMIMMGYVKRARQLGVQVYEGLRVLDVMLEDGRVAAVSTNKGKIATPVVVNAAGAWGAEVGRMVGANIPLRNSARTIVVTNPIAAIGNDYPFVEDLSAEWYFRPELNGVLMGMGARPSDKPEVELDEAQVEAIVEMAMHRVPALEEASLRTAWTGVRPLTLDGRPLVGPCTGVEGFIVNCGWGGVGFIMAPMAGQLAAECVTQGEIQSLDGAPLRPDRSFSDVDG